MKEGFVKPDARNLPDISSHQLAQFFNSAIFLAPEIENVKTSRYVLYYINCFILTVRVLFWVLYLIEPYLQYKQLGLLVEISYLQLIVNKLQCLPKISCNHYQSTMKNTLNLLHYNNNFILSHR
uniref:Uncharacterized protein n=1 Tax=Cacopsylla melanoneura TaxID=428564 RepID=A0A8D8XAF5_9HEMI